MSNGNHIDQQLGIKNLINYPIIAKGKMAAMRLPCSFVMNCVFIFLSVLNLLFQIPYFQQFGYCRSGGLLALKFHRCTTAEPCTNVS